MAANDSDPDENLDPGSANPTCANGSTGCSTPTHGTLLNGGDGKFTYTPNGGFTGGDSFTYEICDDLGLCDTAFVDVTVTGASGLVYDVSFEINTTVPGISVEVRHEEIISYDPASGSWAMFFDASQAGITTSDPVAFHRRPTGRCSCRSRRRSPSSA